MEGNDWMMQWYEIGWITNGYGMEEGSIGLRRRQKLTLEEKPPVYFGGGGGTITGILRSKMGLLRKISNQNNLYKNQ